MLVILEVEKVIWLPSDGDLRLFGNFYDGVMSWAFNDGQSKVSIQETCLELIGAHLYDHFLNKSTSTW